MANESLYQGFKAIDTIYDGCHFRSRLEARWAVFFKSLGIPYQYEVEGFDIEGLLYLPDFWLPEQRSFFEVKGPLTFNSGERKARALSIASQCPVFMFGNIPSTDDLDNFVGGGDAYYPDGEDQDYFWCVSKCCGKYDISYLGRSERVVCCKENKERHKEYSQNHPSLVLAYMAARQHRFDGGEK
jgi:hypothetical protein